MSGTKFLGTTPDSTVRQSWWGPPGGWKRIAGAMSVVLLLTAVSFGLLFAVVIPGRHEVNGQIFGIGLAITAYLLGVRHAFDADHIAAIDNTTRKFVADGKRPVTVGLFFSLGHSTVVFVMALFVALGAKFVATLVSDLGDLARKHHRGRACLGYREPVAFVDEQLGLVRDDLVWGKNRA